MMWRPRRRRLRLHHSQQLPRAQRRRGAAARQRARRLGRHHRRRDRHRPLSGLEEVQARVEVQVGSQVSGNIQKLFADFNSEVKVGQTVAQIDPALFQAAMTQAEGDLATAQAALEPIRQFDIQYDLNTDHGATQGARFP